MSTFTELRGWLTDSANWAGESGIPARMFEHVWLSALAVCLAVLVALPLGLYIGHKRRHEFLVVTAANLGRAVPSYGILAIAFLVALAFGLGFTVLPIVVALFFLSLPPIVTNTYVGVKNVDRDTVEAARGMGLNESQILRSVELPLAAPVIVTGLRTATVQTVATATLAAVIGGIGLGRYIIDGFAQGDRVQVLGGAVLVAILAIVTELAFGLLQRAVRPRTTRSDGRKSTATGFTEPGQVGPAPQAGRAG